MTNCATETNGYAHSPELAGRVRLILGLTMMIAGLYFGLFSQFREDTLFITKAEAIPMVGC